MPASDSTKRFTDGIALDPEARERIGDVYQQTTKYDRADMRAPGARPRHPGVYKRYADAVKVVPLPEPNADAGPGMWEVVAHRRSGRDYADAALSLGELSQMLWACQGITAQRGGFELRTAPSAGALYPIETYLVVNRVADVEPGVYHYNVRRRHIECLRPGDSRSAIAEAALGERMTAAAGVVFVWTAVTARCKCKYGERGCRYMYLDAGHIAAHVSLAAEALGLASCAIGAFFDDEANDLVGVDGVEETVVYMTAVGARQAAGA